MTHAWTIVLSVALFQEPWPRLPQPSQLPLRSNQPLPYGNHQARRFVTHIVCSGAPAPNKCCHASVGVSALPL
jgi:hypothetical protein